MNLVDSSSVIVEIGQRIYCALHHAGMGTVYGIRGTQSPRTIRTLLDGVGVMGGTAYFSVVFDNGHCSEIPEAIARGIQWKIYAEKVDAETIAAALAHAGEVKAEKEAAQAREKEAHAAAIETLRTQADLAHLAQLADGSGTTAAANIRKELKSAFPAVKFSVRKERYGSVLVSWTDGPTIARVEAITDRYVEGHFDGSDDCYKYERSPWTEVFGGARYISTRREQSNELIERAIESVFNTFAGNLEGIERPTADEYRFGHVYLVQVPLLNEGLADLIRRAAYELEG